MLLLIEIEKILFPTLVLFSVALIFGVLIVVLSRVLSVEKDVKIAEVRSFLPGANCAACGKAGCDDFAEAIVKNGADISQCTQLTKEKSMKISEIMGLGGDGVEESIYVVKCCGGSNCQDKYDYIGYGDCISNEILSGGSKACDFGCMGKTTCSKICPYYAIGMTGEGYSKIDPEKCKACGLCAKECPKRLIQKMPKTGSIYVACSNKGKGRDITSVCKTGCIACGLCVKACEFDAIVMVDNLPVIDYNKCTACLKCLEKCPRNVIKKVR